MFPGAAEYRPGFPGNLEGPASLHLGLDADDGDRNGDGILNNDGYIADATMQKTVQDVMDDLNQGWSDEEIAAGFRTHEYYVVYKIQESDEDKKITNNVDLNYSFSSAYSSGSKSNSGSAETSMYVLGESLRDLVIDFGLPVTIELGTNHYADQIDIEKTNNAMGGALYGEVTVEETVEDTTWLVTYTPDKILPRYDVVYLLDSKGNLLNYFRVFPATTVYYEETFLDYDASEKWVLPAKPTKAQATHHLGGKAIFGYDTAYGSDSAGSNSTAATTSVNGATASFTFTGTGFELFANCDEGSGYVTLVRDGQTKKMYMMDTGLNYGKDEDGKDYAELMPGTGEPVTGTFYNIPIITEHNLPHGEYTVTIRKTHNDGQDLEIDGIRIFNAIADTTVFNDDLEDNPVFYELRDVVLNAMDISGATSDQIFAALPEDSTAVITYDSLEYLEDQEEESTSPTENSTQPSEAATGSGESAAPSAGASESEEVAPGQYLLEHGPKNEIYLHAGQTLSFKVKTDRVVQIGLKAPNGATKYSLNGSADIEMNSCVDMFYKVADAAATAGRAPITVSVKNTGSRILAVTLLKICDDPSFAFAPLTQEDLAVIMGEIPPEPEIPTEPETPTEPEIPTEPETPTEPEAPTMPIIPIDPGGPKKPDNPNKPSYPKMPTKPFTPRRPANPGTPGQPIRLLANAELTVSLVDYAGTELDTVTLTARGVYGSTHRFQAEQILEAVAEQADGVYEIVGADSLEDIETAYGSGNTIVVQVGRVATLKVTYISILGKRIGTATITKVQTEEGSCVISPSEIQQAAPHGRSTVPVAPAVVEYGGSESILVTVF